MAGASGASVLTRNNHETRDGFFVQPTLTKAAAATMALDPTFNAKFVGAMWASPLYMENGPGGNGAFIVAATNNNVYALDEATGAMLWMHNIGAAPAKSGAGCGDVAPTGITSTPVIDGATRTIYVAGGIGDANGIMRHEVHALDAETGNEKAGWPVNVSALSAPGNVTFNTPVQNQRGALSLVNGTLFVPYGGHDGDCGQYRGWVVAINAATPTKVAAWATGGIGEAIWAGGGMASTGDGVFAVTGNNLTGVSTHADSEEVVHVSGLAQVNRATGLFYPGSWRTMDGNDADFGSSSPVAFQLGGSYTLAAVTKNGQFFLLNPANLGGMDGQLAKIDIAPETTAMSIAAAPAAYTSTSGVHVVLNATNTTSFCPAGSTKNGTISIAITPGSPPSAKVAWCAGGGSTSPIATSTDGKNETVVWYMDNGLNAVDGDTGATLYVGGTCAGIHQFSSPIAVKGRIIVGGDGNLCAWAPASHTDGGQEK
jgi:putative pyrroloquinoline-quinone binding quinoprotein